MKLKTRDKPVHYVRDLQENPALHSVNFSRFVVICLSLYVDDIHIVEYHEEEVTKPGITRDNHSCGNISESGIEIASSESSCWARTKCYMFEKKNKKKKDTKF